MRTEARKHSRDGWRLYLSRDSSRKCGIQRVGNGDDGEPVGNEAMEAAGTTSAHETLNVVTLGAGIAAVGQNCVSIYNMPRAVIALRNASIV